MVQGGQRLEHHQEEARELTAPESPPPSPKGQLLGIDHVQLAMPAGPEAERDAEGFYGDVLGLERVPKPDELPTPTPQAAKSGNNRGCWFEGPCVKLHLGVEDPFHPARKAHPALAVDDLDVVVKRITDAGGEFRWADDVPGLRRGHTNDPFGNRVELVESFGPTPAMFDVMVNHSVYPIALLDHVGVIRWGGWSIERFFGYKVDDIIGEPFDRIVAPDSLAEAYEAFASIHESFDEIPWGGVGLQVDLLHAEGHVVACEMAALTYKRTGLPWYVVMVRQSGYERALDQAVEAMAAGSPLGEVLALVVKAVENMVPRTGVAVCDRWTGERFAVSAGSATSLLVTQPSSPWTRALAAGEDVFVVDRSGLPAPLGALARAEGFEACWVHPVALSTDQAPCAAIIVWRRVPGEPNRFTWNTMRRAGQLLRLVLQWDRSHRALEFAATHDPLTGLANRQAFHDRMEAVLKSSQSRAAVLYLDLDRFKPVNDKLGHLMGDRALAIVAERLLGALRPSDLVARMGGDEFAVLCERLASAEVAEAVADRLLEVVSQPIYGPAGEEFEVGASIGVTDARGGEMVDTVLARADEAMREAKRSGRGRWIRAGS